MGNVPSADQQGGIPAYYEDTGCELAPSCLDCPLIACQFEIPVRAGRRWWLVALARYAEINPDWSESAIARRLGAPDTAGETLRTAVVWLREHVLDTPV